jgi:hypothetical protein
MMLTKVEIIDPVLAKKYLGKNINNRNIRNKWVEHLANAIKRGEWIATHQGIAFNNFGFLADGQHRLHAIIQANTPVQMMVTRGIPADSFSVLDGGVKRSIADQTRMNKKTSEVCRLLCRIGFGSGNVTAAMASDIYNSGIGKLSDELLAFASTNTHGLSTGVVRTAAVVMMMDGHDKDYVMNLYRNMTLLRFAALPPVAHAFIRQIQQKKLSSADAAPMLGRALKLFNHKFANVERLVLTDGELEDSMAYVRQFVKNLMGAK